MLLSPIKSSNHNINDELLIVFSKDNISTGFYIKEDIDVVDPLQIQISDVGSKITLTERYIILNSIDFAKLSTGDIVLFRPNGVLKLIFRAKSLNNTLFVTEQCNNHCLMCSQPPKIKDDIDYFFKLNTKLINLLPTELNELGISGGEPTLLGEKLFIILNQIANRLPITSVHLLTNGKRFADINYAKKFSESGQNDLLIGIPFHSDFYKDHDYIAQSKDSYYNTLKGLYNLARFNQNIELRIVINQINYKRLPRISEYIFRNLPFVSHVAFMALEYTGLVPKNHDEIWIDPINYRNELEKAVMNLSAWGLNVSIFNLPLCLMNNNLYQFSKKSISDWKTHYFEECVNCKLVEDCGGDFSTSLKHSINIAKIN